MATNVPGSGHEMIHVNSSRSATGFLTEFGAMILKDETSWRIGAFQGPRFQSFSLSVFQSFSLSVFQSFSLSVFQAAMACSALRLLSDSELWRDNGRWTSRAAQPDINTSSCGKR